MKHYCHAVPGRIRIKSSAIKGNGQAEAILLNLLQGQDGIHKVRVNTLTGSVVVNYDSQKMTSGDVLNKLAESGYFDPENTVSAEQYLNSAAGRLGEKVGKAVLGAALDYALGGTSFSILKALI